MERERELFWSKPLGKSLERCMVNGVRQCFAFVIALLAFPGCGCGQVNIEGDAAEWEDPADTAFEIDTGFDPGPDPVTEIPVADTDAVDPEPDVVPDVPPPPEVPLCGNSVVDAGEECDDGNRLNGDGCDWLCRLGDGDPPAPCDTGVTNYVPEVPPVDQGFLDAFSTNEVFPLVWTGTVFATALFGSVGSDVSTRLRRFDEHGSVIGTD